MATFIKPKTVSLNLSGRLRTINVMILDSTPQIAELYKKIFHSMGFTRTALANDGAAGVEMLRKQAVDIIITDWELKVARRADQAAEGQGAVSLSGIRFVERLRNADASPAPYVPVIMMVENDARKQLDEIRDVGVNEIVRKPLDVEELCNRIVSIIDKPRHFITSHTYRRPCRRIGPKGLPPHNIQERRMREVRIIKQE